MNMLVRVPSGQASSAFSLRNCIVYDETAKSLACDCVKDYSKQIWVVKRCILSTFASNRTFPRSSAKSKGHKVLILLAVLWCLHIFLGILEIRSVHRRGIVALLTADSQRSAASNGSVCGSAELPRLATLTRFSIIPSPHGTVEATVPSTRAGLTGARELRWHLPSAARRSWAGRPNAVWCSTVLLGPGRLSGVKLFDSPLPLTRLIYGFSPIRVIS
jgi:hypothetical protein